MCNVNVKKIQRNSNNGMKTLIYVNMTWWLGIPLLTENVKTKSNKSILTGGDLHLMIKSY